MFDPKTFSFDVEKMTDFFKQNDFTKQLSNLKLSGRGRRGADVGAAEEHGRARRRPTRRPPPATRTSSRSRCRSSRRRWPRRRTDLKSFDATKLDADKAKASAELAKAAFEKALANMQALAESAQKANAEAYEIVSARIKESLAELRDLADQDPRLSRAAPRRNRLLPAGRRSFYGARQGAGDRHGPRSPSTIFSRSTSASAG